MKCDKNCSSCNDGFNLGDLFEKMKGSKIPNIEDLLSKLKSSSTPNFEKFLKDGLRDKSIPSFEDFMANMLKDMPNSGRIPLERLLTTKVYACKDGIGSSFKVAKELGDEFAESLREDLESITKKVADRANEVFTKKDDEDENEDSDSESDDGNMVFENDEVKVIVKMKKK